jgi:hypothetical protein
VRHGKTKGDGAIRKLRPLNVPHPIRVQVDRQGRPILLYPDWKTRDRQGEGEAGPSKPLEVAAILEEWRIDDEWWRAPISRRYTMLVLDNGHTMTIYHDLVHGGWYRQEG